jgi:hypothetical protein
MNDAPQQSEGPVWENGSFAKSLPTLKTPDR